jgi:hypothetical protein
MIDNDGHAHGMIKRVRDASDDLVSMNDRSVYLTLRGLKRDGLIVCDRAEQVYNHGRPRQYYRLTPAGRRMAVVQAKAIVGFFILAFAAGSNVPRRPRARKSGNPRAAVNKYYGIQSGPVNAPQRVQVKGVRA